MPPSLVKTIFFVVSEMYRLWEKQAALKNKMVSNKNNFLMLLVGFQVALIEWPYSILYIFSQWLELDHFVKLKKCDAVSTKVTKVHC